VVFNVMVDVEADECVQPGEAVSIVERVSWLVGDSNKMLLNVSHSKRVEAVRESASNDEVSNSLDSKIEVPSVPEHCAGQVKKHEVVRDHRRETSKRSQSKRLRKRSRFHSKKVKNQIHTASNKKNSSLNSKPELNQERSKERKESFHQKWTSLVSKTQNFVNDDRVMVEMLRMPKSFERSNPKRHKTNVSLNTIHEVS